MGLLCVLRTDFLEPGLKVSAHEQRPCRFYQQMGRSTPCIPGFDLSFINVCLGDSSFLCIVHLGRLSYLSLISFGTLHSDGYFFLFLLCLSLLFCMLQHIQKLCTDSVGSSCLNDIVTCIQWFSQVVNPMTRSKPTKDIQAAQKAL